MAKFYLGKVKINGRIRKDLFSDLYWAYMSNNKKDAATEIKSAIRNFEVTLDELDGDGRIIRYHTYKPYASETIYKIVVFDVEEIPEGKVSPHIRGLAKQITLGGGDQE